MVTRALIWNIDRVADSKIAPTTKEAVWKALLEGHKLILTSGRCTPGMSRFEKELELDRYGGYLFAYNGAKIVECRSGEIVYQRTLAPMFIPRLYNFARENQCGLLTYLGREVISAFEPDEYVEREGRVNGLPVRHVVNFPRYMEFAFNKCLLTAPVEKAEYLEKLLLEKFGSNLSIFRNHAFAVEIMPKNVDKSSALEELLRIIGIEKEDTICCDGEDDLVQAVSELLR